MKHLSNKGIDKLIEKNKVELESKYVDLHLFTYMIIALFTFTYMIMSIYVSGKIFSESFIRIYLIVSIYFLFVFSGLLFYIAHKSNIIKKRIIKLIDMKR